MYGILHDKINKKRLSFGCKQKQLVENRVPPYKIRMLLNPIGFTTEPISKGYQPLVQDIISNFLR